MINYSYPLYRPPSEANNIIIQATLGCSHNSCTFCSMYKTKKYEVRDKNEVFKEIDILSQAYPDTRKVFIADGDALSLDTTYLVKLLKYLDTSFAKLNKVSCYATAQNVLAKSEEELSLLYTHKLSLIYFGIETGDEVLLEKIDKGVTKFEIIDALNRASSSNIKVSATVILGIGGRDFSDAHIKGCAEIVNKTTINYLSTLQLGLEENIKHRFLSHFEEGFSMLSDDEVLDEQIHFLTLLHPSNRVIFRSNHASNALALAGTLPKDTQRLLAELSEAKVQGESALVPKMFRGF